MKLPKKYSDTSTRVLETLKILSTGNASIQDIICHFEKIDPNNRTYTNEVILKYINTLKVFGFQFTKIKDKYILQNSPCQFDFLESDLKAIYLLEQSSEVIPEERIKENIYKFLQELERGFSDKTKLLASGISKPKFKNLGINYEKYTNQIQEYEKYCIEGQKLKIQYKNAQKEVTSIVAEPNEIKYKNHYVYLSVYNSMSAQIQDIKFEDIIEIRQLPIKSNPTNIISSVTFKLKGRLAKGYNLHEGERLIEKGPNGTILVVNQQEDMKSLIKRLMRYGKNCEIIYPKILREEAITTINQTLKLYAKSAK